MKQYQWAHTSGPWAVEVGIGASTPEFPVITSRDYIVVGIEGFYGDLQVDWANARLVAAAPVMRTILDDVRCLLAAERDVLGHAQVDEILGDIEHVFDQIVEEKPVNDHVAHLPGA